MREIQRRLSLTLDLKIKLMVSALFPRDELRPVAPSSRRRGLETEMKEKEGGQRAGKGGGRGGREEERRRATHVSP